MLNKRLLLLVLIFALFHNLPAKELLSTDSTDQDKKTTFYAGINPLALIAFLPDGIGAIGTVWGYISGQEFGISLYGGMYFAKAHSLEMRFSTGPATYALWDTQLQFGYIWYPLEQFLHQNDGLAAGFMLRQFLWHHRISDYWTFSFSPELLLGWRFKINSLAFDLRAGWNITAFTWSNMSDTKGVSDGILVPNYPAFTVGLAWLF